MTSIELRILLDHAAATGAMPWCSIAWIGPARDCGGMRFSPLAVANYLCDAVGSTASIGAIHQHVWQLAFAERREHAALALRNLARLIPTSILTIQQREHAAAEEAEAAESADN